MLPRSPLRFLWMLIWFSLMRVTFSNSTSKDCSSNLNLWVSFTGDSASSPAADGIDCMILIDSVDSLMCALAFYILIRFFFMLGEFCPFLNPAGLSCIFFSLITVLGCWLLDNLWAGLNIFLSDVFFSIVFCLF